MLTGKSKTIQVEPVEVPALAPAPAEHDPSPVEEAVELEPAA